MICPNCQTRWADFPNDDFNISEQGIFPKSPESTTRRMKEFESSKDAVCPDCLDELS